MKENSCCIGLGSNIDAEKNLQRAAALLREHWPNVRFSSVWKSAPQGFTDQPDFLNTVAQIETKESPQVIHRTLMEIEQELGKKLPFRFGPRTIDLDLLLYGNAVLPNREEWPKGDLVIPHPRMHERRFVLEPLIELIGREEEDPISHRTFHELLMGLGDQKCSSVSLKL
ncbi:MAG: 2-amino-4-hydroxy-6-hydroxymethyldihydropteridine diphosphokinase [Candidatus Peregrinibacteria bacterium]|nr:2-amino-4-hydroxy-6-hydroxymethyldihydropteridine diphosphokinase [Candidatus Peregrinibacteria bacterium]